jgi:hypothetical protein
MYNLGSRTVRSMSSLTARRLRHLWYFILLLLRIPLQGWPRGGPRVLAFVSQHPTLGNVYLFLI